MRPSRMLSLSTNPNQSIMKKSIPLIMSLRPKHPNPTTRSGSWRTGRIAAALSLLAGVLVLFQPADARAASGTWNITGNGTWNTAGNWGSSIIADGAGNTAFITKSITSARTVTLDGPHTIGVVTFTPNAQSYTLAGTNVLTLDNGVGIPAQVRSTQLTNFCNVVLAGGAAGVRMPDKGAILSLGGVNTYTGDTYIESQSSGNNAGTLRIGNSQAIPHGAGKGNVYLSLTGVTDGALDLFGFSITINGLGGGTAGGQVKNAKASTTSTLTVGDNDATSTFDGLIVDGNGIVALSKIGNGTLTLSGLNGPHTYTGATTISGGTLLLTNSASISSLSTISVGGSGTFDVSGVTNVIPYLIASGQTLNGSSGTGTIAGGLTLDSGALLTLAYAAGIPTINVASGTLTLTANATTINVAGSPLINGSYKLISKSGSGLVAGTVGAVTIGGVGIAGGGTASLAITGDELYLNIVGGATAVDWGSGDGIWADGVLGWNSGGATTFTNGNAVLFTDTYSTGNPTVTLNSTVLPQAVIVLSTNNYTISGSGNIGGSADLRKLGTGALTLGATNTYTGGSTLFAGTLNLNNASALGAASGTFTINGGTLDNTSGSPLTLANYPQVWNANITFTGTTNLNLGAGPVTMTAGRTITVNSSAKLTVGGDISGSGFGIVKSGTGILQLDGANTITASSTLNLGELIIGNDGALNGASGLSLVFPTDINSKTLSLNGHNITIRSLLMGAIVGGTNTVIRNNHPSTPVTLTVNPNAAAQYAGSIIDGDAAPLSLVKDGAQNWTFGGGGVGVGTYSGDTTLSLGTLSVGANNIIPHGAGKGDLVMSSGTTFDLVDKTITLNGLSGAGTVTHTSNANGTGLSVGEDGSNGDFSGVIQNGSAISPFVSFTKLGAGKQILRGANTYTGGTTINGGVLQIGDGGSAGSLSSTGGVTNNASLVINRDGTLNYAGVISGPGTLTNSGPGIVNLTGVSIYTGTTTVSGGTLRINSPGSLTASSSVTVKSGATLGGTGTILSPVTVEGTLAPGASVGTLTVSNTVALQGSTVMEVIRTNGIATGDKLTGVSTLNYGGNLLVNNIGVSSLHSGDSFTLFSATTIVPGFTTVVLPPLLPGLTWNNNLDAAGTISISGTAIPPQFGASSLAGDTLTLGGSGGLAGATYYVLTSTDIGLPVASWTALATNVFDVSGNFSFQETVDPNQPQQFYMITIP